MSFFSAQGIPSASPVPQTNGQYLDMLNGKPAALVKKLGGRDIEHPNTAQCAVMGETMATLHEASTQLTTTRENSRNALWRQQTGELLLPLLDEDSATLLIDELTFQAGYTALKLPNRVIHADLFRDNALFSGDQLQGVIDFYYACNDYLMYDIAVAVNDWCVEENGLLDSNRFNAFIQAYQAIRPFTPDEIEHWPIVVRAASLRFWLSRLKDLHFPKEGELTHIKNPDVMRNVLIARREQPENYRLT
jgi:homoserine kinase type II